MTDEPTCGKGLAEHSPLPEKLATALADNLELHMTALDLGDENAKQEHGVYQRLVQEHRALKAA